MQVAATTAGWHRFPTPGDADFVFARLNKTGKRQTRAPALRLALLEIQQLNAPDSLSFDFVFVQATLSYLYC